MPRTQSQDNRHPLLAIIGYQQLDLKTIAILGPKSLNINNLILRQSLPSAHNYRISRNQSEDNIHPLLAIIGYQQLDPNTIAIIYSPSSDMIGYR